MQFNANYVQLKNHVAKFMWISSRMVNQYTCMYSNIVISEKFYWCAKMLAQISCIYGKKYYNYLIILMECSYQISYTVRIACGGIWPANEICSTEQ
jgi:hypothetical protein